MKTEDLINQLSSNLKPVKAQCSPGLFTLQLFIFSFFFIGFGLAILHLRSDLKNQLADHLFLTEILISIALMVSGGLLIGWTTSPGRHHGVIYKLATFFTFLILLIVNSYRLSLSSIPLSKSPVSILDIKCFITVITYSVTSAIILFLVVKNRVVTSPTSLGAMIGIVSMATGLVAISFHCKNLDFIHISIYHFILPAFISATVGAYTGKHFLRW